MEIYSKMGDNREMSFESLREAGWTVEIWMFCNCSKVSSSSLLYGESHASPVYQPILYARGVYSVLAHVFHLLPYQKSCCLNLMKACEHYGIKKHYFSTRVFWGVLDGVCTLVTNLHSNGNYLAFS